MTELRHIAVIADEIDLVRVLRERLDELNVSRLELDEMAALPASYSSKRLTLPQIEYYGSQGFWNTLEALGCCVIVAEDPAATARYAVKMKKRNAVKDSSRSALRTKGFIMSGRIPWLFSGEKAGEAGKKGGENSQAKRSVRLKTKMARPASLIRWGKVKAGASSAVIADRSRDHAPTRQIEAGGVGMATPHADP
jgi:hypothetical protein